MDDVLRRLGIVETLAAETRIDVSAIKSSFATRADLGAIAADVSAIKATLPHLATRADLSSLETKIIRWIVGTTIAVASVAFTIAKFVN